MNYTWDTLPAEARDAFDGWVINHLKNRVWQLDDIAKRFGSMRYSWEVAINRGEKPGDKTLGQIKWLEAAADNGIDNGDELVNSNSEFIALYKRLEAHRNWGTSHGPSGVSV